MNKKNFIYWEKMFVLGSSSINYWIFMIVFGLILNEVFSITLATTIILCFMSSVPLSIYWGSRIYKKITIQQVKTLVGNILNDATRLLSEILDFIKNINLSLNTAREELKKREFESFWLVIEEITIMFLGLSNSIDELIELENKYHTELWGLKYDNPKFDINKELIPKFHINVESIIIDHSIPVLGSFGDLVKVGQTDSQALYIFEHYKTKKILRQEFETLPLAIAAIAFRINVKSNLTWKKLNE